MQGLIEKKGGATHLLLGNEAVVRGALEAGVGIVTQYPGTPSSEIGDTFAKISEYTGLHFEYSVNEKVALEVAAAAAVTGVRSLTAMKHVGLNVASDSFVSTAYTGVKAGMVIVSADDPSMHSSQNEQDNRFYGRLAGIPILEPATPAETKDFTVYAFRLSEELGIPVMLRMTTRVNHSRGPVFLGDIPPLSPNGEFALDPTQLVTIPSNAYKMHERLLGRLARAEAEASTSPLNRITQGIDKVGVIASGVGAAYAREAVLQNNEIHLLTLGFSFPLSGVLIRNFVEGLDKVLIVEELEPILEGEIRSLLQGEQVKIYGKMTGHLPRLYEYDSRMVREALQAVCTDKQVSLAETKDEKEDSIPPRPPVLCPGCSHRHTYYAVARVAEKLADDKKPIYTTDIGCYTLGYGPPYRMADYLLSMGSSVGTAGGFSLATNRPVIAFIGDSTFFHGGLPALANNVHHGHPVKIMILDNMTTAMTGHQPNPGGEGDRRLSIEELVKGMGVKMVKVVNPNRLKDAQAAVEEVLNYAGTAVIIFRAPCMLVRRRDLQRRGRRPAVFSVNEEKCVFCLTCIDTFACPAFIRKQDKVAIDADLCAGCGVCTQVCPEKAIGGGRR